MNNGWVKLHRRLLDNPRAGDPDWISVWVYLLLNATHQAFAANFDGKIVTLQPGQLITGRLTIAERTGVHESKVKRILQVMKTDQQIDQQAGVKGSIITVRNWQLYQDSDQQNGQRLTSDRPATDQRVTTNKNDKNGRMGETPSPDGEHRDVFVAFVSMFKEHFGETYSHQGGDFVQLAKWRKSHPEITAEQFAETCQQVWSAPYPRRAWLTLRGICSDWSSVKASLKGNARPRALTDADHKNGWKQKPART